MESEPDTVARISPFSSRIDVEDVESSDGDDNEVVHSPLRSNGADSSGGYSPLKGAECNAERPGTSEPSTVNEDAASQARSRAATSGNASQRIHITSTIVDAVTTVIPESYVVTAMPWLERESPLLPHQEAAILLQYARDDQELNGSALNLRSRLCYRLRHKFHLVFRCAAWALVLIHIFERPVWTYRPQHVHNWNDFHTYPSWQLPFLTGASANALTFVCNLVNWAGVLLELGYKRGTKNEYLAWSFVVILLVKTICNIAAMAEISQGKLPTWGVSPIEGLLCILVEVEFDSSVGFILRSIPKFSLLMVCMAVFVMIYTALGMMIFNPELGEGESVFPDYGAALWNMAMVLNGANWPGPMVPALVTNRLYVLYFYAFLIIVVWGILNIVLGFNYLFFQSEQQAIDDLKESTRLDSRAAAFRILDVEGKGYLTYEQTDALLKESFECYEELATPPTQAERYELILNLDIQSNSMITEEDFSHIDEKCSVEALKQMRSQKRKFMRFLSANVLRERSKELLKKQVENLQHVGAKVGLNKAHGVSAPEGEQQGMSKHGYASLKDDGDRDGGNGTGGRGSQFLSEVPVKPEAERTGQRVDGAAPGPDGGEGAEGGDSAQEKEQRQGLIDSAAAYAGKYVNPKVLAWYKSVADSEIAEMTRRRGQVARKWIAHFAMQVDSVYFDIISDTIIVAIGISLLKHNVKQSIVLCYNVFTLLEMALKLSVKGYYRYSQSNRSAIDGKIAITLFVLTILEAAAPNQYPTRTITKTLVLLRTLLYPRNIIVTNGFKDFRKRNRGAFQFAFGSVSHFSFLLLVMVVMMYMFAGVGQQIFGGTIRRGSARLEGSAYADLAYWPLNFNDMPSGMVTMFTLLSVNNMNVTTSGFTAALSQWAEVFFILWYCLGVLFFLNILTAVFLNQFIGYLGQLAVERRAEEQRIEAEKMASVTSWDEDGLSGVMVSYLQEPLHGEDGGGASAAGVASQRRRGGSEGSADFPGAPGPATPVRALAGAATSADGLHTPPVTAKSGRAPSWLGQEGEEEEGTMPGDNVTTRAPRRRRSNPEDTQQAPSEFDVFPEEDVVVADARTGRIFDRRSSTTGAGSGAAAAGAGRRSSETGRKPTTLVADVTARTGAALHEVTAATGALLTDASQQVKEATLQVKEKTVELVHHIPTGLARLAHMIVVDDSQGFKGRTQPGVREGSGSVVGGRSRAGSRAVSTDEVHNPLMRPAASSRRTLVGSDAGLSPSGPHTPMFGGRRASHISALSAPSGVMPLSATVPRRGSAGFLVARDRAPSAEDLEEENDGFTLTNVPEEDLEQPTTASLVVDARGAKSSIFVSDQERNRVKAMVASMYQRKRKANRDRRSSMHSGSNGSRSRTSTLQYEGGSGSGLVSVETARRRDSSLGSAEGAPVPYTTPASAVYGIQSPMAEGAAGAVSALVADAAASDRTPILERKGSGAGAVSDRRGSGASAGMDRRGSEAGVEMTSRHQRSGSELIALYGPPPVQMLHEPDYSHQTWQEWFYDANMCGIYEEGAVLIQGALDAEDPELFTSRRGLWCFQQRAKLAPVFKTASVLYSLLKFFQRPAWTYQEPNWDNQDYFPNSGMPQWSPYVTGSLKIPLLLLIMYGLLLEVGYKEASFMAMFRRSNSVLGHMRHILQVYAIIQFALVLYSLSGGPNELVAYTSCGSMLYVLWFYRRSLRKAHMVMQVVPRLAAVLLLYFLVIFMFAGFGPFLYPLAHVGADDDTFQEYYADFRTSAWSIFVAITTSSYPCQIMPAYREYREFSLFFFLFVSIGTLFMVNLIVAIVFVEFQKAAQLTADYQRALRQMLHVKAFDVLDFDETDLIDTAQLNLLLAELAKNYRSFTKRLKNPQALDVLFSTLDSDHDGWIGMEDFTHFLEASRSKLTAMPTPTFMELWFPDFVQTRYFALMRQIVLYPYTNLIFDCTIAVFTVANLAANAGHLYHVTNSSVGLGAVQMVIMVFEMALKLMVRGYAQYRRSFRNQLDSTITIGAFIAVVGASGYDGVSFFTIMRRVLLIFRLFWLPRNLRYVFQSKGIKRFAKLCWRIVGKTMTLGLVFLCIMYAFAAIGTFAFGGQINRDPNGPHYDALMNSRYAGDGYFPLNFNDFMSSLITVFCCLHVSDFDVIAEGMVVTSSEEARIFFAVWYIVGVLLMLNIVKSFFLDEFLNVFSASAQEAGEEEKGLENATHHGEDPNHGGDGADLVLNPLVAGSAEQGVGEAGGQREDRGQEQEKGSGLDRALLDAVVTVEEEEGPAPEPFAHSKQSAYALPPPPLSSAPPLPPPLPQLVPPPPLSPPPVPSLPPPVLHPEIANIFAQVGGLSGTDHVLYDLAEEEEEDDGDSSERGSDKEVSLGAETMRAAMLGDQAGTPEAVEAEELVQVQAHGSLRDSDGGEDGWEAVAAAESQQDSPDTVIVTAPGYESAKEEAAAPEDSGNGEDDN